MLLAAGRWIVTILGKKWREKIYTYTHAHAQEHIHTYIHMYMFFMYEEMERKSKIPEKSVGASESLPRKLTCISSPCH